VRSPAVLNLYQVSFNGLGGLRVGFGFLHGAP
jgi:hypothetical protein